MANTTFCELREKEIINICDGARLGCICDLEIDDSTGTICSIVVPGPSRFLAQFGRTCYPVLQNSKNRR